MNIYVGNLPYGINRDQLRDVLRRMEKLLLPVS